VDLAIKDVRRHLGKFATTIIGVAVLLTIVLTMNGIYRGNIADGLWLIDATGADLWVVERGRGGPFNEPSRVPQDVYRSVTAVPGVASAGPFLSYTAQRELGGRSRQFGVVGFDPFGPLGGPRVLVEGRPLRAAHFEIIADASLKLHVEDRVRLGLHDYRVVGLTKGAVDPAGNPIVYMALADAQEVQYQQENEAIRSSRAASTRALETAGYSARDAARILGATADVPTASAAIVRLSPGADPDVVATAIERTTFLSVYTSAEERELMLGGKLQKITMTLGLFRSLLLVVSVVIMALIVFILTMDKIKALATLKLLGAPNGVIVRLILEQALALAVLAFAVGYGLVQLTHGIFPRTLVFVPADTLITFLVVFLGGCVASIFGIWRAMRTPSSIALAG
jgi:putative ABC transport system permease protein